MITDMTVMLYVTNVNISSRFWQQLGFREVLRQSLGDSYETVLLMYDESGAGIQLYDIDFIRATQPEMLESKPVLLFSADVLDDIYKGLKETGVKVSDVASYGDQSYITFDDYDQHHFTLIGEYVDRPATEEELAEFDRNIQNLQPISFQGLESLTRPNYIFFGRKTCPWCRRMARNFNSLKVPMYWVNTEGTDASHPVRQHYSVKTVPTLIKRASNGLYVKLDEKKQSFFDFVSESK